MEPAVMFMLIVMMSATHTAIKQSITTIMIIGGSMLLLESSL